MPGATGARWSRPPIGATGQAWEVPALRTRKELLRRRAVAPPRFLPHGCELIYLQTYDPLGNALLSTLVAALPVAVLFYLLVFRRLLAPWAAAGGAIAA